MTIHVLYFFYVNVKKDWKSIVLRQLEDVKKTGILSESKFYVVCCDPTGIVNVADVLKAYTIEKLLVFQDNRYEFEAIQELQRIAAKESPDDAFVYFHSKGMVMHDYGDRIPAEMILTRTLFKNWQNTLNLLQKYSKIGLFPSQEGWIWYNFWWTTGKYLQSCKPLVTELNRRHDCESFIGRNGSSTFTDCYALHNLHKQHYTPEETGFFMGKMREYLN